MRRPVVGVMGSGSESWAELARPLGALLADRGVHLLTGGGGGVMESVSRAFCSRPGRAGLCLAVLPCRPDGAGGYRPRRGYPNAWVEVCILSPLDSYRGGPAEALSRNHINVLTGDALIVLPGSRGTRNEAELALRYATPALLFGPPEAFDGFPDAMARTQVPDEVEAFLDEMRPEVGAHR